MWGFIIAGLIVCLLSFAVPYLLPIGIILIIIGLIIWASNKRYEKKERIKRKISETDVKKCPRCAEEVKSEAVICRFCGYSFQESVPSNRIPCSDGSCIGVINEKGVCDICGKPKGPKVE